MLTAADIRAMIADIAALDGDDEAQHGMQDALWEDVLADIAQGADAAPELAAAALKVLDLEFSRWCA